MIFILPTDTCYGLAGSLTRNEYEGIYTLKGRDFTKQLALLVRSYEDMREYIEITDDQIAFLQEYPHPWSFLGKRNPNHHLPDFLDPEKYAKISLRVAENCIDANIRNNIDYPLFLTSANLSGHAESRTLAEARAVFPELDGIDGGICDGLPSDIFSIGTDGKLEYLRRNY